MLKEFYAALEKVGISLRDVSKELDNTNDKLDRQNTKLDTGRNGWGKLISTFIKFKLVANYMTKAYSAAADFIETRNLFHITFSGNNDDISANEEMMEKWSSTIHNKLHVAEKDVKQYASVFNSILNSLDSSNVLGEQNILTMTKELTQISLDFASQRNLSFEDSFNKILAGISGTIRPLRRMGVSLNEAAMQEWVYNQGINMTVRNLAEADKAYIRYRILLETTSNAQKDLAQTIWTPANLIRILKSELNDLMRTFGYLVVMLGTYVLPMVKMVVEALTLLTQKLANALGFDIKDFDQYFGQGENSIEDYFNDATESANETAKAMKQVTLGFDELHTLSNNNDAGSGANGGKLHLPYYEFPDREYDFYGDLENNENYQKLENAFEGIKKWAEEVGNSVGFKILTLALQTIFNLIKDIAKFFEEHPQVFGNLLTISLTAIGILGIVSAINKVKDGIIKLKEAYTMLHSNLGTILNVAGWFLIVYSAINLCRDIIKLFTGDTNEFGDNAKNVVGDVGLSYAGLDF